MAISVLKFGGTSLATHEDFHKIATRLNDRGKDIVVVVSAQSGMTDQLLKKMYDLVEQPPVHAIDALLTTGEQQSAALMAAALTVSGRRAEVVPPWHIFETNGDFGDADIDAVDVAPIHERLRNGIVPVVGGFTGRAPDGRLCTLGRGGSDYTAVALGAALGASVELCKADTDGVYDCDPNVHPDARRFDSLSYEDAFDLAADGAKVLHSKAAAAAREGRVQLTVRHTFKNGPGTRIVPVADAVQSSPVPVPTK